MVKLGLGFNLNPGEFRVSVWWGAVRIRVQFEVKLGLGEINAWFRIETFDGRSNWWIDFNKGTLGLELRFDFG